MWGVRFSAEALFGFRVGPLEITSRRLVHRFRKERALVVALEDVDVVSPRAGVAVVSFTGEHDLSNSASVSDLLDSLLQTSDLVVADVSHARFIDSSMLHVLMSADRLAKGRGKDFRIQLGAEATVKRVFQISGVLEQLTWAPSRDEALNGSQPAPIDGWSGGSDGAPA